MLKEIPIKADASGKNAMLLDVNGKRIRFNNQAVAEMSLKDHVNVSLATTSDDENAKPDRMLIRTNHKGSIARKLGSQNSKWRDLNSEEILKATRLPEGKHPILFDEENQVHYVELQSDWAERTSFDKKATKARNKDVGNAIKANREKSGTAAKAGKQQ